jgi:acyl-coenzyme A thioesterase PaaI-like protein
LTSDIAVADGSDAAAAGLAGDADGRNRFARAADAAPGARQSPLADFTFEPHRCFACGELNEHGLHLQLHASDQGCWTELAVPERFQGWDAVAHGGIVTTLLDEVMAWSVIGRGTWGVTARIWVSFRRPVPTERPIRAEGWVVEDRRRTVRTAGRVVDASSGTILAEGEATFVAAPPDELARLKARYRLRRSDSGEIVRDTTPDAHTTATTERVDDAPGTSS